MVDFLNDAENERECIKYLDVDGSLRSIKRGRVSKEAKDPNGNPFFDKVGGNSEFRSGAGDNLPISCRNKLVLTPRNGGFVQSGQDASNKIVELIIWHERNNSYLPVSSMTGTVVPPMVMLLT